MTPDGLTRKSSAGTQPPTKNIPVERRVTPELIGPQNIVDKLPHTPDNPPTCRIIVFADILRKDSY
jgi:hypothetical protein